MATHLVPQASAEIAVLAFLSLTAIDANIRDPPRGPAFLLIGRLLIVWARFADPLRLIWTELRFHSRTAR